jgi:hypothetical protein
MDELYQKNLIDIIYPENIFMQSSSYINIYICVLYIIEYPHLALLVSFFLLWNTSSCLIHDLSPQSWAEQLPLWRLP